MIRQLLAATLLGLSAAPAAPACDGVRAERPWIRQPPPGAAYAAAYFRLVNDGTSRVRVTAFSSSDFETATLHETRYHEGRAEMRLRTSIELAPGEALDAAPGGTHIMLAGARSALEPDMLVEISLECMTGPTLAVWFPVRRVPPD